MKPGCRSWKEALMDAALTGRASAGLEEHLSSCAGCAGELAALRAGRERLDALLPLVARGAEPPAGFATRVLAEAQAASEAKRGRQWPAWVLAGAVAAVVMALILGSALRRKAPPAAPDSALAAAERLAEWRAPSDVLLETPGREILARAPRLGGWYLPVPVKEKEEE